MKNLTAEDKAIQLFNEQLGDLVPFNFPDMVSRKNKAKANVFSLVANIKIALYESSYLDKIPSRAFTETLAFYSKVLLIVEKF